MSYDSIKKFVLLSAKIWLLKKVMVLFLVCCGLQSVHASSEEGLKPAVVALKSLAWKDSDLEDIINEYVNDATFIRELTSRMKESSEHHQQQRWFVSCLADKALVHLESLKKLFEECTLGSDRTQCPQCKEAARSDAPSRPVLHVDTRSTNITSTTWWV